MSGALAAMVGGGNAVSTAVTLGDGGGFIGYASGVGGLSVSSVKGATITSAISSNGVDFSITLSGTLTKSFVTRFVIVMSSGAIRAYNSSDATFTTISGSNWQYGSGSSRVWTDPDVGSIRRLLIYY